MKQLEQLQEIAEETLGGLEASQRLKDDILRSAQALERGERVPPRRTPWARRARAKRPLLQRCAALACACAVMLGLLIGVPCLLARPLNQENLIAVQQGGDAVEAGRLTALDVPPGSITISNRDKPAYRGIWAPASGANFPLISVEGRYYRLLTSPSSVGGELLGNELGTVDVFTSEPALASGGVISNAVEEGAAVYAVRGMGNALVAAPVEGVTRLFQRVSFGNNALTGGESLRDTLGASAVTALEISGLGTVTDSAQAQSLYDTLLSNATLTRAGASETGASLLIQYANGLVLQMSVRDESVMACGTWTCPEFFAAFREAVAAE